MNYFLIAGEASGDLHGGQLINALKELDREASFSFFGGDEMRAAAAVQPIVHYRDMAFMGFIEVLKHLRSIMGFMARAKQEMTERRPDALILIDYPSFNLKVARLAADNGIPVFYFISPKVWAWKQWRVKDIKRYVKRVYSILPFEVEWYRAHQYEVKYVGNPTVAEVNQQRSRFTDFRTFATQNSLDRNRPIIALVPGSRRKEIADNLPSMCEAALRHGDAYQAVVAGAPAIDDDVYRHALNGKRVPVVTGKTLELVSHARVALVTSGTATLETAVIGTPQVACYRMNGSKLVYKFYSKLINGKYVTLPNLIADQPVIPELLLHNCNADTIDYHLSLLLDDGARRSEMLEGYKRMMTMLGDLDCARETARCIIKSLS